MSNLQEEHNTVDTEIVCELIQIIPDDWDRATLEVEYLNDGGNEAYSHSIKNPARSISVVTPSNEIYELTREQSLIFQKYDRQWKKVIYSINSNSNGDWDYKVSFEY